MKKLTQEEFERRLKAVNCTTNDVYVNNITNMKFKHMTCGNEFVCRPMELFNLKNGKCPVCQKYRHYTFDELTELFKSKYPEYTLISKTGNNITVKHTCGEEFTTTLKLFFKARIPCPKCSNRNAKKTDADFKKEVFNLVGNEYTFLDKYINNMTKLKVIHNKCGHIYEVTPNKFLQLGRRCPYCAGYKKKTLDEVKAEISEKDPDYEVISTEYKNSSTPIQILHKKCGHVFSMRRTDFLKENGNRCPYCKNRRSIHEEQIEAYLKEYNIPYIHQYKIKDNRSFDFYINNKILLEYDGEYHYKHITGSISKFKNQQKSDIAKDNYCKQNNLLLVRIPYWYKDNIAYILDKLLNNPPKNSIFIQANINSKIEYFEKL